MTMVSLTHLVVDKLHQNPFVTMVSQPLLEKKCMMAKVSGTHVQMEVFSWTHLVEKVLDRTIPLAFIMGKNADDNI